MCSEIYLCHEADVGELRHYLQILPIVYLTFLAPSLIAGVQDYHQMLEGLYLGHILAGLFSKNFTIVSLERDQICNQRSFFLSFSTVNKLNYFIRTRISCPNIMECVHLTMCLIIIIPSALPWHRLW